MTSTAQASSSSSGGTDDFPRQAALTRRFTCGRPRAARPSPDGARVVFLRSRGPRDPVGCLWVLDLPPGAERCVLDPREVGGPAHDDLPPEERARRERLREGGSGVVAATTDDALLRAAVVLSGRLAVVDLLPGGAPPRWLDLPGPAVDPRPSPDGSRVAVVVRGAVHVVDVAAGQVVRVAGEEPPEAGAPDGRDVTWGLAEFVAAEEMGRTRGHWWSPDGSRLLVARVDVSGVQPWWIGDPADPSSPPQAVRYPAAGTADAEVSLHVVDAAGARPPVAVDTGEATPYLARVVWDAGRPPTVLVQTRDQRLTRVLAVDPDEGSTTVLREQTDEHWVDLVDGAPAWSGDALVTCADSGGTRRLRVGEELVTPPGLQVRAVLGADDDGVLLSASSDPVEVHVHRWTRGSGLVRLSTSAGVHGAAGAGELVVLVSSTPQDVRARTLVLRVAPDGGVVPLAELADTSEDPVVHPAPLLAAVGERALRTALLLPTGRRAGDGGPALPALLDPYGGPHAQRVLAARAAYLTSQWFADQGFAVVVADGRGTPGRGPAFEREVAGDLASAPLADQLDALDALDAAHPGLLDLSRVGVRGWSFGGYLAALAVLRAPDRVHAAVAGAPVTDWRLYDTHYTERYLGLPSEQPEAYERSSLLADAPALSRPLMLLHGLADDNVVAAHSLRLSGALLAAGRPHELLPLAGVTHMTPQADVAENLLRLQVEFLHRALAAGGD